MNKKWLYIVGAVLVIALIGAFIGGKGDTLSNYYHKDSVMIGMNKLKQLQSEVSNTELKKIQRESFPEFRKYYCESLTKDGILVTNGDRNLIIAGLHSEVEVDEYQAINESDFYYLRFDTITYITGFEKVIRVLNTPEDDKIVDYLYK